ncbi:MAG TPA: hypothetical protein VKA64_09075 [Gammaproteobacteria bacterium]|nr:hypothetical protein [Gammaproteobacteria bacterium]
MTRLRLALTTILLGTALAGPAGAATDAQEQAIRDLGAVNGVALNCGYFEQVKHMKHSMIVSVPKMRTLGMVYEDATDESYRNFVEQDKTCPTEHELSRRVDKAVARIKEVFAESE